MPARAFDTSATVKAAATLPAVEQERLLPPGVNSVARRMPRRTSLGQGVSSPAGTGGPGLDKAGGQVRFFLFPRCSQEGKFTAMTAADTLAVPAKPSTPRSRPRS